MSIEPAEGPARRLVPVHGPDTPASSMRAPAEPQDDVADPGAGQDKDESLGVLGYLVGFALAAVIVAPVTLSASHLIKWAHSSTGLGLSTSLAWLAFVALDLAAVVCIGMTVICAKRGEGAGGFSVATWVFALGSAFSNYSGGHGAGQWFFPAMSLAGPTLLEMVLAKVKRWARISEGTQLSARPKFGIRWVPGIAARETARAWAAARRENIAKAADAIAFVREVDVLARMNDTDAVRYATAAARTSDPHTLRQWLTSRGKDVAQAALPTLPATPVMDEEIARDGAPLSETFAPMPKPIRLPREAMGLPPAPEPMTLPERPKRNRPASSRSPRPATEIRRKRPQDHPKWAVTEATFRESIAKGAELSQRKLADAVPVHRNVAKAVIEHVKNDLFPEEG